MHSRSRSLKGPILAVTGGLAATSLVIGAVTSGLSQAEPISRTVRIVAQYDSFTTSTQSTVSRDSADRLVARNSAGVEKTSYLRFEVTRDALGQGPVLGAKILLKPLERLPVPVAVRVVSETTWSGRGLTYRDAPSTGRVVGTARSGSAATRWIDVSSVVNGPGTYSFALTTELRRGRFFSSETEAPPTLLVRMGNKAPRQGPTPAPSDSPTPDETKSTGGTASPAPSPDPTVRETDADPADGSQCAESFPGDPCDGTMYYGASVEGGDPRTLEAELGQGLTLFRSYMQASSSASKFASRASTDVAAGRIPLISTKVPGNSWGEVANGTHDAWLLERIKALAAVDGPVWLTLHHEPRGDGDPVDWVRMQQRARALIDAHSTNIALVGILNGWDFLERNGTPERWRMPVGTGVHVMGFDSYNPWSLTNGDDWKPADRAFSPGVVIQGWGYPTLVGEHGVRTDPSNPGQSAQWLKAAYDYALAHGFVGVSYFDSGANSPDGTWDLTGERLEQFGRNLARGETAHLAR